MKKIRAYTILTLVTIALISLIFSSFVSLNIVYAAVGDGIDTQTTARQKLWYSTLAGCINNKSAWKFDKIRDGSLSTGAVSAGHLKNDNWFDSNAIFNLDGRYGTSWGGGAYIESMVGGEYKDGKIYCGENNNKLVRAALSELGLSEREIICGANGKEGVMYGDVGKGWDCITAYDNGGELELDSGRNDYFANLVAEKTFGGNIPGGTLTALTDLEAYYIYRDDFMSACAIGDPRFGDESQPYQIKILNEETGKFEVAGYAQRNTPSTRVYTFRGESKTCAELSNILNDSEYFDAYEERYNNREDYDDPGTSDDYAAGTSDSSSDDTVCYDNSGAIGWILCPVIKGVSGIAEYLYEQVEENFLQIQAGRFFESGGGLETTWGYFRDFANIAFIILFLIVIFSQLTGVGIDNYGIKKIMPKLIVTAILVNLSFIICELAADVSNIFGAGLKGLFSGLGSPVSVATEYGTYSVGAGNSLAAIAVGSGGALLYGLFATGFVGLFGAAVAVGLAVLSLLVSLGVSIFFMYVILLVRNAGIIILIAIAPVAFVCRMLPNTEKFFKKWVGLFKALLVVYPICGLMIGGGRLAGHVLASLNNAPMALAGMLVEVLPFFLIPTLLKSSLAMMGNVGAKLSGAGRSLSRGMSGGAQRGVTNSEGYKNAMQYNQEQRSFRRAARIRDRLSGRTNLSTRQQNRLRQAEDVVLSQNKREAENEARVGGAYFEAMGHKQDLERENEQAVVEQYNRESFRDAKRATMADDIRRQQSKERTTLMMNGEYNGVRYSQMGLPQLQSRWEQIFRNDNNEYAGRENERLADLDALTGLMSQRYGTSAANSIGQSLSRMRGVAGNATYQRSLRTLQQTMTDNSALSGNLKNKASDAFQMISDAGMRYDQTVNGGNGGMVYEDLDWFSGHNSTATQAKDWATASGATLQRAVDNNMLSERMLNELLTSEDPAIRSGLQSEDGKREILEAALYNRQHNPSGVGPSLPSTQAAQRYENEQVAQQAQNELHIQHEREAERRGKTKINVPGQGSFDGYAVPDGFRTVGGVVRIKREANGDWVYTDVDSGRQWNASTGTYKA